MNFSAFELEIIDALTECKGSVKTCAKNAIHHLKKAWIIKDTDLEMSMFRAITAEEEAASALFHCVKNHQYKNADKLLFKRHLYKLGLHPFLISIELLLAEVLNADICPFSDFYIHHCTVHERKCIELVLKIKNQDVVARPTPPLNFSIKNPENNKIFTFDKEFEKLITSENFNNSIKYIQDVANFRNKLLYADSQGLPSVIGDIEPFIQQQKKRVMKMLAILLMIDPWQKEGDSLFIQQALDSFLILLNRISDDDAHQFT